MNLVDLVKSQITSQVAGQLGNLLGGTTSETKSAVEAAVPALLAALAGKATGGGADRITVILNAIDPQQFQRTAARRQAVREALGYAASDVVVGAVGRHDARR